MAEKPEAAAAAAPAAAAPEAAAPKGGGIMGFLPLIVALVLAPVISWAVAEFLLLPRMKAQLLAAVPAAAGEHGASAAEKPAAHAAEAPKEKKAEEKKPEAKKGEAKKGEAKKGEHAATTEGPGSYTFENMVVNLAGTMGTRYLKVSFLVTGKDTLRETFEERKAQLVDTTLNTLGSLTLADLEQPGSRSLIRARLIAAYNEAVGSRVAEQIYFSDFVVQ